MGLFLLILGVTQLVFGIYIFYLLLPVWYGLFGIYLGYNLGEALFGVQSTLGVIFTWLIAFILGGALGFSSYYFEPYRRFFVGALLGITMALIFAGMFALNGFASFFLAIIGGLAVGFAVQVVYDPIVILGTSFSGAAFILQSLYIITSFDMFNLMSGMYLPIAIWITLGILGVMWQSGPIRSMTQTKIVST